MKKIVLILMFLSFSSLYSQRKSFLQRWSVNSSLLVQNSPTREIVTVLYDGSIYAKQFKLADVGNASLGAYIGGAYDLTFKNGVMFRIQTGLETTGNFLWTTDIGTGIRVPSNLGKKHYFSVGIYFSVGQSFGNLKKVGTLISGDSEYLSFYLAVFGVKTRMSYEIPLSKNYFISPFISYSAYPWKASSVDNEKKEVFLNGIREGAILDGLYIGLEFGQKFN